jgi:hypothetical protein
MKNSFHSIVLYYFQNVPKFLNIIFYIHLDPKIKFFSNIFNTIFEICEICERIHSGQSSPPLK